MIQIPIRFRAFDIGQVTQNIANRNEWKRCGYRTKEIAFAGLSVGFGGEFKGTNCRFGLESYYKQSLANGGSPKVTSREYLVSDRVSMTGEAL